MDVEHHEHTTSDGPGTTITGPPALPTPEYRPTGASLVVLVGVAVAFFGVVALHVISSDVDPIRQVMSHYANGSHGRFMSVVFYAFGVTAIALGWRLRSAVHWHGLARIVPALLVLAGLSLITSGVFEVDRPLAPESMEETIHSNAAVGAFVMTIVAMLLFAVATHSDTRWRSFRWTAVGLAALAALAAVGTLFAGDGIGSGGIQRLLAGAVLAWFLLTAIHLRGKAFSQP